MHVLRMQLSCAAVSIVLYTLVAAAFTAALDSNMSTAASSRSSNNSGHSTASAVLSTLTQHNIRFRSAHDAVALALHTYMIQHEYKCTAAGLGSSSSASSSSEVSFPPSGWNSDTDTYTFHYAYPSTGTQQFTVLCKYVIMEQALMLNCIKKAEKNSVVTVDINTNEYVNSNCNEQTSVEAVYKDLDGLLATFERSVYSKITPPKQTVTAEDSTPVQVANTNTHPAAPRDFDPLRIPPRNPNPYAEGEERFGHGVIRPDYGRDDLDPFVHPPGMGGMGGNLLG